ncbi:MAG TPA: hypothetical protein VFL99_08565 [Segeticoccus sp.]|uniref:hypothetical protein n=1 Tax=Segeticoccus sp. TaxID=2706531 RepID=UPI002D7E344C|nr:hypothetical protein [Segeticoccus sp.]HET8600365.1 hypothetical protein [Segeticoccus sp.]
MMTRRPHTINLEGARRLTQDAEPFLSCDDCFDQVDAVVDDLLDGTGLPPAPFRAHLAGCPGCHEEAMALLALVAADTGRDPAGALRRLERLVAARSS